MNTSAPTTPLALVGGTLIDGLGGPPLAGATVVIEGERFARIGTASSIRNVRKIERVIARGEAHEPTWLVGSLPPR